MKKDRAREPVREDRIAMEIIPDCQDDEERASGWYSYLEDVLTFPFAARCASRRAISPLEKGDDVEVIGLGPGDECAHEMFVFIHWEKTRLAVPLGQLEAGDGADAETAEAVNDWLYWQEWHYGF